VYDLCVKYRDIAAEGGDTAGLLPVSIAYVNFDLGLLKQHAKTSFFVLIISSKIKELEEILAADGCSLEKGCEAAFMVNKMVNFEFVYNAHLDAKSGRA
jgi:hypothetical protein